MLTALTEADIAAIINRPNFWHGDLDWNENPPGGVVLVAKAILVDDRGITIPGLTAELQYRRRPDEFECDDRFTVFQLLAARKRRAYQIEVKPETKISHAENGVWFGPHQHFGERAAKFDAARPPLNADHRAWFYEFLGRANITFTGEYRHPEPQRWLLS